MSLNHEFRHSYRPGPFSPRRKLSRIILQRKLRHVSQYLSILPNFFHIFSLLAPFFTRDPTQLRGEKIQTTLVKSMQGLGFTIVGGDDNVEEFLQIKSVVPNGPAWLDGRLKTGKILAIFG